MPLFSSLFPDNSKVTKAKKFLIEEWFQKETPIAQLFHEYQRITNEANGANSHNQELLFSTNSTNPHHRDPASLPVLPMYIGTWWLNASAWIHLFSKHLFHEWILNSSYRGGSAGTRSSSSSSGGGTNRSAATSSPSSHSLNSSSSVGLKGIESTEELSKLCIGIMNMLLYDVHKECRHIWFATKLREKLKLVAASSSSSLHSSASMNQLDHQMSGNAASAAATVASEHYHTSRNSRSSMMSQNSVRSLHSLCSQNSVSDLANSQQNNNMGTTKTTPTLSRRQRNRQSGSSVSSMITSPNSLQQQCWNMLDRDAALEEDIAKFSLKCQYNWQKTFIDLSLLKLSLTILSQKKAHKKANKSVQVLRNFLFSNAQQRNILFTSFGALSGWYILESTPLSRTASSEPKGTLLRESLLEWDDNLYLRSKTLVDWSQIDSICNNLWEKHCKTRKQTAGADSNSHDDGGPPPTEKNPTLESSILITRLRSEIESMQCLVSLSNMLPKNTTLLECFDDKARAAVIGLVHSLQFRSTTLLESDARGSNSHRSSAELDTSSFIQQDSLLTADCESPLPGSLSKSHEVSEYDLESEQSDLSDIFSNDSASMFSRDRSSIPMGRRVTLPQFSPSPLGGSHRKPTAAAKSPPCPPQWKSFYTRLVNKLLMNHLFMNVYLLSLLLTPANCHQIMEYANSVQDRVSDSNGNPLVDRLLDLCDVMETRLDHHPLCAKLIFMVYKIFICMSKSRMGRIREFEGKRFQEALKRVLLYNSGTHGELRDKLYQSLKKSVLQIIGARYAIGEVLLSLKQRRRSTSLTNQPVLGSIFSIVLQMLPHKETHKDTLVPVFLFLSYLVREGAAPQDLHSLLMDWMSSQSKSGEKTSTRAAAEAVAAKMTPKAPTAEPRLETSSSPSSADVQSQANSSGSDWRSEVPSADSYEWPPKEMASQLATQSLGSILRSHQKTQHSTIGGSCGGSGHCPNGGAAASEAPQMTLSESIGAFFKAFYGENVEGVHSEGVASSCKVS